MLSSQNFSVLAFILALFVAQNSAQNACSNLFTFSEDRSSGTFELPGLVGRQTTTSIEIAVSASSVDKNSGELKLADNPNQTQRRLENNKPIRYRFKFPPSSGQVIVTKIAQGNTEHCYDDAGEGNWRSFIEYSHTFHSIPGSTAKPSRKPANNPAPTTAATSQVDNRFSAPTNASGEKLSEICGISNSNKPPTDKFELKDWPWLSSIRHVTNSEFHCTGTLITPMTVASAGHCFQETGRKENARDIIVYLGVSDASQESGPNVQRSTIQEIYYYHGYRPDTFENDFALLVLTQPVRISEYIRPACIWPNPNVSTREEIVNAYGYVGAYNSITGSPSGGKVVKARSAEDEMCNENGITSRSICVENVAQEIFCQGDSGAGLIYRRNGKWTLRGVLSAASVDRTNCISTNYIIYADASPFWWWLRATLRDKYSYNIET